MREPKPDYPALDLALGDVVQLNPETVRNRMFAGCMLIVSEAKPWGAMGYVQALGSNGEPGGQAWYRAQWAEMDLVGRAAWVVSREGGENE